MNHPIFAVDPGNIESAYAIYCADTHSIVDAAKIKNAELVEMLKESKQWDYNYVFEMIASYGMPVGKDVFNTCVWIGRFIQTVKPNPAELVYRKSVKLHLCGTTKAKDSNIRQAILDLFPVTGGGSVPQVGTKKQPGPLYGFKADMWAALAVALTYANTQKECAA